MIETVYCNCKWAVAYEIDGKTQDDKKEKITVVALFEHPTNAEDCIRLALPNKERFFVCNVDEFWDKSRRFYPGR